MSDKCRSAFRPTVPQGLPLVVGLKPDLPIDSGMTNY